MSFEAEFLNFCLSCDGNLPTDNDNGPYCSQACRLADLEKGGASIAASVASPTTPIYEQSASSFSSSSSLSRSFPSAGSGFHLPPAIDFGSFRRDSGSCEPILRPDIAPSRSFSMSSSAPLPSPKSPTTYGSVNHSATVTKEAKAELRRYESLFDQTRHRGSRAF